MENIITSGESGSEGSSEGSDANSQNVSHYCQPCSIADLFLPVHWIFGSDNDAWKCNYG